MFGLPSLYVTAIKYGIIVLVSMGIGSWGGYKVGYHYGHKEVEALQAQLLAEQTAKIKAIQAAVAKQLAADKITHDADVAYAESQQKLVTVTKTIIKEVPVHVTAQTDASYPVPCGLVRVWDAAVLGVSADALPLPAGKSDDSACPVKASVLASAGTDAIRKYIETSNQLVALQGWISSQEKLK